MELPHDDGQPFDDGLQLVTLPDAAAYLAISRGALYNLMNSGALCSVHIGRARRVPLVELRRFVAQAMEAST
jgi:excisionase family DNA binding protein